ncbi:fluoride efflux transporter CrcB [Riemerella columbipharyngis]|uniref:Fluoride-specific ion channel FluC n=1 Tax=Riemerella columbipharyngis TaxID=1071918 RepID=A0A1G7CTE6_9FLAO|nr:fluoride efflux transporter CrcB [Riemerella columbipharyngis]SDE42577.1 CrcB protein [Riemerella columbipharyngis]
MKVLYIFLGGGIGSVLRFLISGYTQKLWNINHFPAGTMLVNVLGCFLIGLVSGFFIKTEDYLKFFLAVGFCGGFTTFSTFSAEALSLLENHQYTMAAVYVFLSIFLGVIAVYFGVNIKPQQM